MRVVSCSSDLTLKVWDTVNAYSNLKTLHGHDHTISSVRFIPPRNDLAVSCSRDRSIRLWDILSGYCVRTISNAHSDWIRQISPTDDGAWYLSAGNDQVYAILATAHAYRLRDFGMLKAKRMNVNTNCEAMNMSLNVLYLPLPLHIPTSAS
jgi:WD40 repeat protein